MTIVACSRFCSGAAKLQNGPTNEVGPPQKRSDMNIAGSKTRPASL